MSDSNPQSSGKLKNISAYLEEFSVDSRPDRRTVIRRIQRGYIVGRRIGGMWYVDPDQGPPERPLHDMADEIFRQLSTRHST